MILSNNLENEFIDFVSGLLDEHLCNTEKSFFRYRQDVNGSINALRKSITDSYTASVLDKLLDCNLKMVRHQTMCALIRGVTFGIDYRRSYVPEDGRIGDLSGYRNLIYVKDYADLHEEAASLRKRFKSLVTYEKWLEYRDCMKKYDLMSKYIIHKSFNIANDTFLKWEKKYCGETYHF